LRNVESENRGTAVPILSVLIQEAISTILIPLQQIPAKGIIIA